MTLHFELQSRFSHSLGGDTCTITLQPRLVVIRYSLDGDILTTAIRRGFALYEYILVRCTVLVFRHVSQCFSSEAP